MAKGRNKLRRAYLKQFFSNRINVTQAPRSLVMDWNDPEGTYARDPADPTHRSFDRWFDNHGRVRSVVGPRTSKAVLGDNTWTKDIPSTIGRVHHSYFNEEGVVIQAEQTPKENVNRDLRKAEKATHVTRLQALWASTDGRGHGVMDFWPLPGIGHDLLTYKLKLFCSGSSYAWVEQIENTVRISYTYPSKDKALNAKYREKIGWIHKFELDT